MQYFEAQHPVIDTEDEDGFGDGDFAPGIRGSGFGYGWLYGHSEGHGYGCTSFYGCGDCYGGSRGNGGGNGGYE
jgi:hypothetical protein